MFSFKRWALISLVAVYLLIGVGGLVRSSGSGLGCPDWPKCFGQWIPPLHESDIDPAKKAHYFQHIGETFNPVKTWTEYMNRLVGVSVGLFILIMAITSFQLWPQKPAVVVLSWLSVILVAFEGWLGAVVVATRLKPWVISVHMVLALILVVTLLMAYLLSQKRQIPSLGKSIWRWTLAALFILLVQSAMGTQVREVIDEVSLKWMYQHRELWLAQVGLPFWIHRSFSWFVLGIFSVLLVKLTQHPFFKKAKILRRITSTLLLLLGVEMLVGMGLAYFGLPPYLQPIHLLIPALLTGLLVYLLWLSDPDASAVG